MISLCPSRSGYSTVAAISEGSFGDPPGSRGALSAILVRSRVFGVTPKSGGRLQGKCCYERYQLRQPCDVWPSSWIERTRPSLKPFWKTKQKVAEDKVFRDGCNLERFHRPGV